MRRASLLFIGLIFLAISGVVVYKGIQFVNFINSPMSDKNPKTIFYEVEKNMTPWAIIQELEHNGIISNAQYFYWYGRFKGNLSKIKAGDYRFLTSMKPDEVMNIIISGISYGIPFRVPEGLNHKQIADILEGIRPDSKDTFIKLCNDEKFISSLGLKPASGNIEGYLFPDTYLIRRKMPVDEIIAQMVLKHKSVFTEEMKLRAHEIGFTPYQILTMASVIEKETGAAVERPKISSVFHNRLKKKMKLQSDPTVIYGIPDYSGNIHREDLLRKTPYNTYVIKGLPLGPICNPGKEAIVAALNPEETPYLFFVSHNDGTHEFTTNFKDHQNAVNKFQINSKAREGKSWRQLDKSKRANNSQQL